MNDKDTDRTVDQLILTKLCGMEYDAVGMLDVKNGQYKLKMINSILEKPIIAGQGNYDERVKTRLAETILDENKEEVVKKFYLENVVGELEQKEKYTIHYSIQDNEGEQRYKKMVFCYLDEDRSTILYARHDITDVYYKEQEQLRITENALEQVRESNQLKSRFMSRMSHDIRTPHEQHYQSDQNGTGRTG